MMRKWIPILILYLLVPLSAFALKGTGSGSAPGGSAGGDLGGTYPSPTVTGGSHLSGPVSIAAGGNITSNGGTLPSVGSCGSGSPTVTANSTLNFGSVTVGTGGVTTCPITFATACTNHLDCVLSDATTFQALKPTETSTSVVTITAQTDMSSDKIYWHCGCN